MTGATVKDDTDRCVISLSAVVKITILWLEVSKADLVRFHIWPKSNIYSHFIYEERQVSKQELELSLYVSLW